MGDKEGERARGYIERGGGADDAIQWIGVGAGSTSSDQSVATFPGKVGSSGERNITTPLVRGGMTSMEGVTIFGRYFLYMAKASGSATWRSSRSSPQIGRGIG